MSAGMAKDADDGDTHDWGPAARAEYGGEERWCTICHGRGSRPEVGRGGWRIPEKTCAARVMDNALE